MQDWAERFWKLEVISQMCVACDILCIILNKSPKLQILHQLPESYSYIICVCSLFNDALNRSDYIALNGKMISEWWVSQDVDRTRRCLLQFTVPEFLEGLVTSAGSLWNVTLNAMLDIQCDLHYPALQILNSNTITDFRLQYLSWDVNCSSVSKSPAFYGTRKSIILSRVRCCSQSWSKWIQPTLSHPICIRSILILFFHLYLDLPSSFLPTTLSDKKCSYMCFLCLICMLHV